jgi:hypothetical protein
MSQVEITPAPNIFPIVVPSEKWDREHQAFVRLLPSLLAVHRHKFVAIHDGQVVVAGDDHVAVAQAAYAKHGYVPIYVGLVSELPATAVRISSPRLLRTDPE